MLKIEEHFRRPFSVEAVQVTRENMAEVAEWCGGEVTDTVSGSGKVRAVVPYVKVPVQDAKRAIATMALTGNWVVKMGTSFRVYNPKVFGDTFEVKVSQPCI